MKKVFGIAVVALMMAGAVAMACDTCGCKDTKVEKKACCAAEKKCDKCTAEKKCDACAKKCDDCTKKCSAKKAEKKAEAAE